MMSNPQGQSGNFQGGPNMNWPQDPFLQQFLQSYQQNQQNQQNQQYQQQGNSMYANPGSNYDNSMDHLN